MEWRTLAATQVFNIVFLADSQGAFKQFPLHTASILYLRLDSHIHLLPETWNRRHTGRMRLSHRLLNLSRIGVDDELCTFRQRQISPSAFEDMGERQEVDDAVVLSYWHILVVGDHRCMILSVGKHHTLRVACGTTRIEDITQVFLIGLSPQFFHLRLSWQIGFDALQIRSIGNLIHIALSQFQEILKINGIRIMRTDAHTRIKNNDAVECRTQREDAVCLVVLLLLAYKQHLDTSIMNHILDLLLRAGGVERNGYNSHAIGSEVCVQILEAVLGEDRNRLLRFQSHVEQSIGNLLHAYRELVPRHSTPFFTTKMAEGQCRTGTVFLRLFMNQYRKVTSCLHKPIFLGYCKSTELSSNYEIIW